STLWFLIANKVYAKRYRDKSLLRKYKDNIQRALTWLSYQDMGEDSMLEQQPTSDWQDAFPHKYGHTINTQALYYHVLRLYGNNSEAKRLWNAVNKNKDDGLWNDKKGFYFPYRWKNHNKYKEIGDWFDSLGNLLAIVYELADKKQSNKILDYIKRKKINKPFPVRAIDPPIDKKHKDWKDYYLDSDAGIPYHYLNAGIWTFIGGIYVCALVKMKRFSEAEKELQKLAEANLKKPFYSEWLHGKTGKPGVSGDSSDEGNQGWNAAMYVVAFESVRRGKALA
ncbi:MAG: glycoside hydrolase 100 family protein, partial [Candidatus Nanoarchaeia archaeon]